MTPPNIIEIGGIHCAPGKPLPQDLQLVMEEAPQVDKDNYDSYSKSEKYIKTFIGYDMDDMTCIGCMADKHSNNLLQGVILVSFGSAVKPSQMTKERRAIFLDVFSQLGELMIDF